MGVGWPSSKGAVQPCPNGPRTPGFPMPQGLCVHGSTTLAEQGREVPRLIQQGTDRARMINPSILAPSPALAACPSPRCTQLLLWFPDSIRQHLTRLGENISTWGCTTGGSQATFPPGYFPPLPLFQCLSPPLEAGQGSTGAWAQCSRGECPPRRTACGPRST